MRLAGFFLKQLHHETPLFYKQNKILYFLFLQRSDFNNKFLTQLVHSNSLILNFIESPFAPEKRREVAILYTAINLFILFDIYSIKYICDR